MRLLVRVLAGIALLLVCVAAVAQQKPRTFVVACGSSATVHEESSDVVLHSLAAVNALVLSDGDRVLLERGSVCHGALNPHGAGFVITATGDGPLPRIEAGADDEAALSIFNADHVIMESLELHGGTTYGVHVSGDRPEMQGIVLRNLTVSGVRGPLKKKESGLVVISPAKSGRRFTDATVDGVRAFDTTQWAGILIKDATHVTVENSVVHDVQGDGIVLFGAKDGRIAHSVAWHTGMQATETIGTPNAIWTWSCDRCVVEDNEAFLTDSPGIDGGAFDIDWGNSSNTVERNFGHDTQGYCVSIFGANEPTMASVVDGNVCLNNGMSPKLAQRQGAILLMSWNGGSIDGVSITNNQVDWASGGNTLVVQTGQELAAHNVLLQGNEIRTTGTLLVSDRLHYKGRGNYYTLEGASQSEMDVARKRLLEAGEIGSTVGSASGRDTVQPVEARARGWKLQVRACGESREEDVLRLFVDLKVAVAEYGSVGLEVNMEGSAAIALGARDFGLEADGVKIVGAGPCSKIGVGLEIVSPHGETVQRWDRPATAIELGLALRKWMGLPEYGRLRFEPVAAKG